MLLRGEFFVKVADDSALVLECGSIPSFDLIGFVDMTEEALFQRGSVQVTKTRVITPVETYAVNGIISVKTGAADEEVSSPIKEKMTVLFSFWGIIGSLLGGAYLIHQDVWGGVFFLILIFGSWFILVTKKKVLKYSVILKTSLGEIKALESEDLELVIKANQAINQAIIARG